MSIAHRKSAFINIPYDPRYEDHLLAYVAGLTAFGLQPRATLELTGGARRLDRIFDLIAACRYSFHDLSFVELDSRDPVTPRFNMPFELGLVVGWERTARSRHTWFVFESSPYRLQKSLSDLNGTDPFIYGGSAEGILGGISNALSPLKTQPTAGQMQTLFTNLKDASAEIKKAVAAHSLFEPRAFAALLVLARRQAERAIPGLP